MESARNSYNSPTVADDIESLRAARRPKWPFTFWFILKVLCLYHHRRVVTRRRCFRCHVSWNIEKKPNNGSKTIGRSNLDWLATEYESSSSSVGRVGAEEEEATRQLIVTDQLEPQQSCDVCATLWWNFDGVAEIYTEDDIGVGRWNHRGSGLVSAIIVLGGVSLLLYDIVSFMVKLWARPRLILNLLIKGNLYVLYAIFPGLAICTKIRSWFESGVPHLAWATALNVRYLIRRVQILDIGRRGLPGQLLLIVFCVWAFLVSFYRFMVFAVISDCGYTAPVIVTSVVALIFAECFAMFMYLIYLVRTSFQRQFALLTYYIKEREGRHLECNGAICAVIEDYASFKMLCNVIAFVICPVMVFGIAAIVTNEYLLTDSCVMQTPTSWNIEKNVFRLAWIEIGLVLAFYVVALGGLQVEYLLNNFITNLSHLKSDEHSAFWRSLFHEVSFFAKESHVFLITVVLSFLSFFTAFKFDNQDISDLTDLCNGTYHKSLCV